jgi:hypothetical protein
MRKPARAAFLAQRNIICKQTLAVFWVYTATSERDCLGIGKQRMDAFYRFDDHVRGAYYSFFEARDEVEARIDNHTSRLLFYEYPASLANQKSIPYQYVNIFRPHHRHKRRSWLKRLFA